MSFLPTILSTLYLGIGVALINNLPWELIFLFLKKYGIRYYVLQKREECKRIQRKIGTNTSHIADNNKGFGYSIGYYYFLSINITSNDNGDQYKMILVTTESFYNNLIKEDDEYDSDDEDNDSSNNKIVSDNKEIKKKIDIWGSFGNPQNRWYRKRTIKIPSFEPLLHQIPIMEAIIELYKEKKHATVFLHGPPGTGKSIIGLLLTNHFEGSYCKTLKFWKPGDLLENLYLDAEPTENKPLIIVLNEIDIPLVNITKGIPDHRTLDISVQDKAGWNDLFDDICIGMYPYLIILMTSNKSVDFINQLDPSYLRDSRVDLIYELKQN